MSDDVNTSDDDLQHPVIRGLKTVCRCNNIKVRTIERAIREGARTLTQVAARTTATAGHCGGSCTPDVQEMLAGISPSSGPSGHLLPASREKGVDAK
jgi:NAD(P)H-nitrite reductase large subunit